MLQQTPDFGNDSSLSCDLPQDIINACQEIGKRAHEAADPTKFSHITLPNDRRIFKLIKSGAPIEVLISLICRPTLNVCELLKDEEEEVYSIELPLTSVKQKLTPVEISAEIILQHILFNDGYMDRSFMIGLDFLYDDTSRFNAPVNMKYSESSYAIFDIENSHVRFPKHQTQKELLGHIWQAVLCLYDRDLSSSSVESDYRMFLESGRVDGNFGNHLAKKAQELINTYDHIIGKELFIQQCKKSEIQQDYEILYENFINNLLLVHITFSENPDAIEEYVCYDIGLALSDIHYHLRAIGRILIGIMRKKQ